MSELVQQAKTSIWEFRMAIFYATLFSFNALGTVLLASLQGVEWSTLDTQEKFLICVAAFVNWSATMMAFISKQAGRIKQSNQVFPMDTTFVTKQTESENKQ